MIVPMHRHSLNLRTSNLIQFIPTKTTNDGITFDNGSSRLPPPFQSQSTRTPNPFKSSSNNIAFLGGASILLSWLLTSDDDGV